VQVNLQPATPARYVDQGGNKRPGVFVIYIEPWHADLNEGRCARYMAYTIYEILFLEGVSSCLRIVIAICLSLRIDLTMETMKLKLDLWGDLSTILQSERSRILGGNKSGKGIGFVLVHLVRYFVRYCQSKYQT
jgi:ribonucleotide reductase alpha subunit